MANELPQLIVTTHEARTLIWWINRRSKIDMDPKYQRHGRLWSISDKAYLIDSIINGFDIPKLYLADFTRKSSPLNEDKLPYAIIDGKQRLEAIFDFYDGKIALNDDFIYRANPNIKIGGLGYKDLKQKYSEIAEEFENANLTIMSVQSNSEELINELFVRLNRSKPLTGAEIRNAMTGPAVDVIREISKHEFFTSYIKFNIIRMSDKDTAAKLLMFEFHGKILETKRKNLDEFVEVTSKDLKDKIRLELSGRKVFEWLTEMTTVFLPRDELLSSSGVIPVYYWLVRNIEPKYYPGLREYLLRVEKRRKKVIKLVATNSYDEDDQEFIRFISYFRSINDASSTEGRYKFLLDNFMKENT
ncbi:MAG: DUF262 domain-containing protein [Bellilinea sp.]